MTVKFKNNAVGYLSAAISSSDSSATLTTGGGASFPSLSAGEYFYATITATSGVYEIVKVTSRSTDSISITRAQEGTTALAFPSGSIVELRITAQAITDAIADSSTDLQNNTFTANGTGTSVGLHIGSGKTLNATDGTVLLPAVTSPAQTADGSVAWDSDDNLLTIGDGSSRKVMVDTTTAQTLTNKTLTAPVIATISNTGTLTLPTSTDTLVGRATTDTLTNKTLASPATTGTLSLAAGTATTAPLKFVAGVNLSTAAAGATEYDGAVFYGTTAANSRGIWPVEHFMVLTSTNTLSSQTAAQPIFDGGGGTTNGALTLPIGTYFFECAFSLTSLSSSSGSFGFAFGGTATISQSWRSSAAKPASLATATAMEQAFSTTANTTIVTANTNTNGMAYINGVLRVTVAGTVVPQVSLGVANAAVVGLDSYFRAYQVGNSSAAYVGNWG
jgi:hypothetical protein